MLADRDVSSVACGLGAAVDGVVLGRGDRAIVLRIIALHAGHKGNAHARSEERIFAVGFLSAAPARIAEDVDVGSPEVEALKEHAGAVFANRLHVLDAPFGADDFSHLVNRRRVEGGGQPDGLGKLRGAAVDDAVQRLAPPVVGGNIKPRNRARLVDQLADLFIQRHAMNDVGGTLLGRQAGIEIGGLLIFLRYGSNSSSTNGD